MAIRVLEFLISLWSGYCLCFQFDDPKYHRWVPFIDIVATIENPLHTL